MKESRQKYFTIAVYAFAVLAFSILFLTFCINFNLITTAVGSFFSAIGALLYAILFALLLLPAVRRLESGFNRLFSRKKPRPMLASGFAIGTALLLAFAAIALLFLGIVPSLTADAEKLYSATTSAKTALDNFIASNTEHFPFLGDIYRALTEMFTGTATSPIFSPISALGTAAGQLSNIFLGLIIAVYFLATRRMLSGIMGKIVFAVIPARRVNGFVLFFKRLYTDFSGFAFYRIICAFLISVAVLLICLALQIPLLSIIVVLTLVAHLIPVIGPILGDTAAVAIIFILKPPYIGCLFAVLLLLLELFFTRVLLQRSLPKKLRPSYALTALAVLIGYFFFGIIGAFVAIPLYATLNIEVRRLLLRRLKKKGLPANTEAYRDFDAKAYAAYAEKAAAEEDKSSNENG